VVVDRPKVIAVVGEGVASATPDRCALSMELQVQRSTVAEAVSHVTALANRALETLEQSGVDRAGITTRHIGIQDAYDQSGRIAGRTASYSLVVANQPLDRAGALVASVAETAGDALHVHGISLTASDAAEHRATARRRAVEDAKTRASQLADAAGVQLGEMLSIEEGTTFPGPRPMAIARSATFEMAAMPVEPGQQELRVTVSITFAIADGAP
jgi:uncharacterized protein YggE